ncbi:MAG: hypothetical protein JWO08_4733 [Verrucomicrobiaceae bacterium]|nr:hypothetical protein [Verrucomicrobiaceae bacterium]
MNTPKDDDRPRGEGLSSLLQSLMGVFDPPFWDGLDEVELKAIFDDLCPVWDLRPESIVHNEVVPEAISGALLYLAKRDAFIRHCADAEIYQHEVFKKWSGADQIHRVIGQWRRGEALTPPLFFRDHESMLRKVDGHHRITVALLCRSPVLPFYCKENLHFDGIYLASSDHFSHCNWMPSG